MVVVAAAAAVVAVVALVVGVAALVVVVVPLLEDDPHPAISIEETAATMTAPILHRRPERTPADLDNPGPPASLCII